MFVYMLLSIHVIIYFVTVMKSTSGFRALVMAVSQSGVSVLLTWSITDQWLACCLLSMAAEEMTSGYSRLLVSSSTRSCLLYIYTVTKKTTSV